MGVGVGGGGGGEGVDKLVKTFYQVLISPTDYNEDETLFIVFLKPWSESEVISADKGWAYFQKTFWCWSYLVLVSMVLWWSHDLKRMNEWINVCLTTPQDEN